jgi:hypothetical protein
MNSRIIESMRELHSRDANGIRVRLLWHPEPSLVAVAVDDKRSGESFAIDVRDGERPLDVFDHPFAYYARRVTCGR